MGIVDNVNKASKYDIHPCEDYEGLVSDMCLPFTWLPVIRMHVCKCYRVLIISNYS